MKKLCCFLLVALLALLCATAMADCATEGHRCDCSTPDVCWECGATGVTGEITHSFENEIKYETDATRHFVYCAAGCGELLIDEEHYIKCTESGTACSACGEPASAIRHEYGRDIGYDAENHWWICADCGATDEKYTHDYDYCWMADGLCNHCGAPTTNVMHTNLEQVSKIPGNCVTGTVYTFKCGDCGEEEVYTDPCTGECYFTQMFDATGHWVACTGCGEVMQEKTDHMIPCDKPGTCKFCKATGLVGEGEHWFVEPGYDEKQHWYVCEGCGEKGEFSDHYNPCDSGSDTCMYCPAVCGTTLHTSATGVSIVEATCQHAGEILLTCDNCGEQWTDVEPIDPNGHEEMERISFIPPNCKETGTETVKCVDCGVVETWVWETGGECFFAPVNAGATHKIMCAGCGTVEYEEAHVVSCKGGNTCVDCGATGVTGGVSHVSDGIWEHDANQHWKTCLDCGVEMYDNHWISCADGTCLDCGATGVNGEKIHWTEDAEYDANSHWWPCLDCGEKCWMDVHYISCKGGNTCADCGATGVTGEVSHRTNDAEYDANGHWWTCLDCGEKVWAGEHHAFCDMNTTICMSCGISGVNIVTYHSVSEDAVVTTATEHWWICTACKKEVYRGVHEDLDGTGICYCGQPVKHEHTWEKVGETAATCTVAGKVDYKCAGCTETKTETVKATGHSYEEITIAATCAEAGYERTVCAGCGDITAEKMLYPTGHNWVVVNTVDATCTEDGRIDYDCRNCDAGSVKRLPATGHTLVDGACACGYAEEAPAEEPAEVTEEVAEVPVKVIENVTVEAATEGETISSDVALIVSEPEEEADIAAILPEEIVETVAKVYFVKLTEKGEEIEVSGSLKITIELEEGEDLTGKKLMLLKEDGTLVEIEYEIIEGKLVFVTEAVGTFVLVDAPAE